MTTLAEAQRQVWVRRIVGGLLTGLAVSMLLLYGLKRLYVGARIFGEDLLQRIDALLQDWFILDLLWRAMPPWQPMAAVPTTPRWEDLAVIWGALLVGSLGGFWIRSAQRRQAQIMEFYREMQREAWREQARTARGGAPAERGAAMVIQQGIWHQYPAPPEPWSQTLAGVVILGLIVTVGGGLIVGLLLRLAESGFFQPFRGL